MNGKAIAKILVIFFIVVVCSVDGFRKADAADWQNVFALIKKKYDRIDREIQDVTIKQNSNMQGMTMEATIYKKGPKYRMESVMTAGPGSMPGGRTDITTIYDGKDYWMISPFIGKQKMTGVSADQQSINKDWWQALTERGKISGIEKMNGIDCYLVQFDKTVSVPWDNLWIDTKRLVLIKAERGLGQYCTGAAFSDYRKVKGSFEIPFLTNLYNAGKPIGTTIVKSVEVNKGFQENFFDPQSVEAKGEDMRMRDIMQGVPQGAASATGINIPKMLQGGSMGAQPTPAASFPKGGNDEEEEEEEE